MSENSKPNEITLTRVYDAPVKTVWDAWTDPAQAAHWWGPRGFTLTTHSKDLRPGGQWIYTMHGPDGTDYPNIATYLEIDPHRKMVYDHGATPTTPPLFRVTVLFTDLGAGKTKMDMTMALDTAEAATETRKFIKKAGGESTWDRLAEYLADHDGKNLFVINRSFDAPQDKMFDMWTDPRHISQWLPPTGFTMQYTHADIRPGGHTNYSMSGHGLTMYGRIDYLQIERPHRLTYTQIFTDETGNLSRHPKAPTWPPAMLTQVTLTAESPSRTRVTVTWQPHGPTTPQELQTFLQSRAGMTTDWTGSFDKLESLLVH